MIAQLTDAQAAAAAAEVQLTNIKAAPGSGKTLVAAMRYGALRYDRDRDARAVVAVSFTRAATAELRGRVQRIWGRTATLWPNRITTLDGILRDLLEQLLEDGLLYWPNGHKTLKVIDSWFGEIPHEWGYKQPVLFVHDRQVGAQMQYLDKGDSRPLGPPWAEAIKAGIATHDDVRRALEGSLADSAVAATLSKRISTAWRALIVDEVYDANRLDLTLIRLAADAGITVTLVGDPWQALYLFRNANPEMVPALVADAGFTTLPLDDSFRFRSAQMQLVAARLRDGQGIDLPASSSLPDIVIGMRWRELWKLAPASVLPLSFGRPDSTPKAAANLMLHAYVNRRLGRRAIYLPESLRALGFDDHDTPAELAETLRRLLTKLGQDPDAKKKQSRAIAQAVWEELRQDLIDLGAVLPKLHGTQTTRFAHIRSRLLAPDGDVTAGMTVHQAKGREWNAVHLVLTDDDQTRLRGGLTPDVEADREIYVAATRARYRLALAENV